jgi:hypothetical protein
MGEPAPKKVVWVKVALMLVVAAPIISALVFYYLWRHGYWVGK